MILNECGRVFRSEIGHHRTGTQVVIEIVIIEENEGESYSIDYSHLCRETQLSRIWASNGYTTAHSFEDALQTAEGWLQVLSGSFELVSTI